MKLLFIILLFIINSVNALGQVEAQDAFNEGVKFLKAKRFIEAEKKFSVAILKGETQSGLKMSCVYKAFAFNGLYNYDSAIVYFEKALNIDSLDLAIYIDKAKTQIQRNNLEKAKEDFLKVLNFDSTGEEASAAYYYLGRIKMRQGEDASAIKYFDKLLELKPIDFEGYFFRGIAKSNLMNIDGSIEDYDNAIKYNPNYMEAYANRGVLKINKIPTAERIGKRIDCLVDPCKDLIKAKKLGDVNVDDMIYLYCKKCK